MLQWKKLFPKKITLNKKIILNKKNDFQQKSMWIKNKII